MSKKIVIGVDLGTTTIKSVFLDTSKNEIVLTLTKEIFPVATQNKEYIEFNPKDWWDYTVDMLNQAFTTKVNPKEVAGICFGGWTVMAFFVKKDGTPVTNAVHYNDMRHEEVLAQAEAQFGDLALKANANYIGMYSCGVKQYWWKIKQPQIFEQADLVATEVSWINYMLTGNWVWSRTQAGFFCQYNAKTKEWDKEIIKKMGFKESMFPKLADAWEIMGKVGENASKLTGLPINTPVFAGVDDASPVALATGVIKEGQGYVSAGSGANIAANTRSPITHQTTITYPHCIQDLTTAITVMSSTGLSYKWMRNTFGDLEVMMADKQGVDAYELMNKQAQASKPGSRGVVFLPYLDGDYTPNNDINAKGVFIGMDTYTTKGDMYRATLEGVAFSMLDNIMLIRQLGGRIDSIVITGGIAKSNLWLQIISDVTNCNISLPKETQGAPLGSAIIAAVGTKLYPSIEEAVSKTVKIDYNAFVPNKENNKLYKELYKVYKSLYPQLKTAFLQLADIKK